MFHGLLRSDVILVSRIVIGNDSNADGVLHIK
jgi:hypothetical protein